MAEAEGRKDSPEAACSSPGSSVSSAGGSSAFVSVSGSAFGSGSGSVFVSSAGTAVSSAGAVSSVFVSAEACGCDPSSGVSGETGEGAGAVSSAAAVVSGVGTVGAGSSASTVLKEHRASIRAASFFFIFRLWFIVITSCLLYCLCRRKSPAFS